MTQQDGFKKPRVLFICAGNTARSQMAQVLLEQRAPERFEVASAGLTVEHLQSKGVKPLIAEHFHYVITVCDRAEANCPVFSNARYRMSWPFKDPTAATGTQDERLVVFHRVRDEINLKVQDWLKELA